MLIAKAYLIVLLLMAGNAVTWSQVIVKDLMPNDNNERDRRALDFGLFVRNLLLKSATASNAKGNISRNVLNFKTATAAPTRRTTTTTTTTVAPFFFNKGPFRFPFDLSAPINNKFKGGYLNFDYDYGSQQPLRPGRRRRPTTTTTTTTAAPAPATTVPPLPPPRRRPIPRRPYGFFGKQKFPLFDYYYDDYDYNYDDATNPPMNNAPPPNPSPPPAPTPAATPAPAPNPPPAMPVKQPTTNRNRAQGRLPPLRNRLIYRFRQPGDTSTNNNAVQQPAAAEGPQQPPNTNANNSNNDETSTNANDDVYDDVYNDSDDGDVTATNGGSDSNNNISDDNTPNTEQDDNDSSDNANPNVNQNPNNGNGNISAPPPLPPPVTNSNFDFSANAPPFQGQFSIAGNPNPSVFANFAASAGFPYSPYNNFNPQYQPSSPAGYSVRYY